MAEIPSSITSSAAQAGIQSGEVARGRDATRANTASAASRQVKAAEEAGDTVETGDDDSRVSTDAEGSGSQGRTLDDGGAEREQVEEATDGGITTDEDGQVHLDLEA